MCPSDQMQAWTFSIKPRDYLCQPFYDYGLPQHSSVMANAAPDGAPSLRAQPLSADQLLHSLAQSGLPVSILVYRTNETSRFLLISAADSTRRTREEKKNPRALSGTGFPVVPNTEDIMQFF